LAFGFPHACTFPATKNGALGFIFASFSERGEG